MREAVVCFDSWAGRTEHRVEVIGETPKRYRVRWLDEVGRGGNWIGHKGAVSLVPKYAVRFPAAPEPEPAARRGR